MPECKVAAARASGMRIESWNASQPRWIIQLLKPPTVIRSRSLFLHLAQRNIYNEIVTWL
ncbi:MAG TPA: hypothetical protein VNN73_15820 [Blastocatellia bacterium]|nr:hypothetical protein [Blastocatellia bacterium]